MNDLDPPDFNLGQNYPNPFSEKTTIKFCVAYRTRVKLEVFSSEDELVRTLLDEEKEAGTYMIEFSASEVATGLVNGAGTLAANQRGLRGSSPAYEGEKRREGIRGLCDGRYVYRLEAGGYASTKRMTLRR